MILASQEKVLKSYSFETENFNKTETEHSEQRDIILKTFKTYLDSESQPLTEKFKEFDKEETGKYHIM